jgi:hypothetical protein
MSKPESIKIDPWTDFPKLPYSFITDDFVHEKLFVGKVNAKGGKSTVNLKATVGSDKNIAEEVKLWFDLPNGRSFYSKTKNNYFRVQLDNGITEEWGQKWNLYAGLNANKSLENSSIRLGVAHLGAKCHTDNRLKVDVNPENRSATWYNRTVVTEDKFTFGVLAAYGLLNHVLVKNNIMVGYRYDNNTSIFLRLLNNGYRKTGFNWSDGAGYFDHIKLDFISSQNDWKYGLEVIPSLLRPLSTPRASCSAMPSLWSSTCSIRPT